MNLRVVERSVKPIQPTRYHDRQNPNTWDILYLDQSVTLDPQAKAFTIQDLQNWTRRYLLIPIKIIANLLLGVILLVKQLLPFQFNQYEWMHRVAVWFINTFVSPEASFLIVRHFGLESNILNFLIDNSPDPNLEKSDLYPRTVDDLVDQAFLKHDLNLYNFIFDYATAKQRDPDWVRRVNAQQAEEPARTVVYNSIQPVEVTIDFSPRRLRVLDLESTLELFKIIYSFCFTPDEFERALYSLPLDEALCRYVSTVVREPYLIELVGNRYPLIPKSPFDAARNLILHGFFVECLHSYLEQQKQVRLSI
ncbi:DUF6999 family protein [Leptolyngbya sp. AN03gr2]|uniref:DUF6999 family protein n=1 Tax=unclassified Leptolyngbya TaxID=2650499 RepID=UPI003D31D1A3